MMPQILFMNSGPQLLIVDSADFDGTSDYMARGAGLTGASDSKSGILSVWLRKDGGDASAMVIFDGVTTVGGGTSRFRLAIGTDNKFFISARNSAGTEILSMDTTSAYTAGATWLHLLFSWDLSVADTHDLYVNDVDDDATDVFTDDTIDYTVADWGVGAPPINNPRWDGCMAELYFAPGQFLDFSKVSNRRKFISASGKPVFLGSDGSMPTGTAPLVYLHLDDSEAVANFATNRSSGGDFSITGTLETGSTSPSD